MDKQQQYLDLGLDLSDSDLDCDESAPPAAAPAMDRRSPSLDSVSSVDMPDDSDSSDGSESSDDADAEPRMDLATGPPSPAATHLRSVVMAPLESEAARLARLRLSERAPPSGPVAAKRPWSGSGDGDRPARRPRGASGPDSGPRDDRPPRRRGGRRRNRRRAAAAAAAEDQPAPKRSREEAASATTAAAGRPGHRSQGRSHRGGARPQADLRDVLRSGRPAAAAPPCDPSDALRPNVLNSLETLASRVSADRIGASFDASAAIMRDPFAGGPFDAPGNPWAPALAPAQGPHEPEKRRMSWEALLANGPLLHRLFEEQPRPAAAARALRECVLRNENLIEGLASADETLSWCKMCLCRGLPVRTRDPIVATAGAVLANLRLRLGPFMRCYMRSRGSLTLDDICARRCLADARDVTSFTFIALARIAHCVAQGRAEVPRGALGVSAGETMDFYTPGACMAGAIEMLDTHRHECGSYACRLTASHTLVPVYNHGKYFYCNMLF
ncbi:multifunctional expression regulator [Ateline alphaherpesvirus 1]|uniref:Multifunctional expression regulator n=1 Tax=Herpesvirus ateles type 1 (strain Lennette) TaxID=35243 RepID=A0A1S6JLK7_HSVA1|nr:multifunctional expression regulator [Ateline alphaherpesvirus 1]AQS79162.1 multifunctional expression regulator [Ateline alphaherpesvirus 1]